MSDLPDTEGGEPQSQSSSADLIQVSAPKRRAVDEVRTDLTEELIQASASKRHAVAGPLRVQYDEVRSCSLGSWQVLSSPSRLLKLPAITNGGHHPLLSRGGVRNISCRN